MYSLDLSILYFFNRTIACGALDSFFDAITNVHYWYPIYVLAGLFVIYRFRWRGVWMVLGAILLITATDSLGHNVLKPLVDRVRPCATPSFSRRGQGVVPATVVPWIRLPDGARGDGSFPSNHALNNFAQAIYFFLLWPRKKNAWWLFLVAFLISIGRVYQGLHYPSDVLGGALIGLAVGWLFALGLRFLLTKRFNRNAEESEAIASADVQ